MKGQKPKHLCDSILHEDRKTSTNRILHFEVLLQLFPTHSMPSKSLQQLQ